MPTSADIYLMKIVGYNILFRITKTVIETFLYGAFMVIFFATITTMIRRGLQSWPSIIIFSITIVNFVLVSTVWTCHVVLFVRTVKYCLMDQTAATFNSKTMADLNELYWRYDIALTVFEQLMLTLSDSVVIWRAWVLVPRRWIMAPPILLVVGSTACAFAYVAIESTNFRWYIVHTNIKLSLVDLMMDASLALSFLANTWTTLLITHTLWLHMRFWKTLKLHKKPPKVLKVLVILIDTGLAFLLLQVCLFQLKTKWPGLMSRPRD
ncbi:hypothetical protein H2248_011160 [Termitomyces sp. 'cryptogamus']|nr:hypothetical protein H2248_011160 [Termitomyces sp. 'cryptogamus']